MRPSTSGWYWYHGDFGWEVLEVFRDADMGLMVRRVRGPAMPMSCYYGTWGNETTPPPR